MSSGIARPRAARPTVSSSAWADSRLRRRRAVRRPSAAATARASCASVGTNGTHSSLSFWKLHPLGHDADDRRGLAVDTERAAEHVRIAVVAARPDVVADDDDRVGAAPFVAGVKPRPISGCCRSTSKKLRGHPRALRLFGQRRWSSLMLMAPHDYPAMPENAVALGAPVLADPDDAGCRGGRCRPPRDGVQPIRLGRSRSRGRTRR